MLDIVGRHELRWALVWAAVIVLFSSVPYIIGYSTTPDGYSFVGLTHNIDDGAVYLSWMRQAADGHFFQRNLFTNQQQPARTFNILFLMMGWCAAITHLPLIWVFHLFRIVLGIALILGIWRFSTLFLEDETSRRILIPLVGLSAGFGWLFSSAKATVGPVDLWQPEAITFLSIYLNPLFIVGLLLMIGSLYWLELTRREVKPRYAAYAGIHLLILGNVHTYDVLTVACIWIGVIIYGFISKNDRSNLWRTVKLSALAAIIAAPSVAYQFWIYSGDPIFRARANTIINSPALLSFILGYGAALIGAIAGAALIIQRHRRSKSHEVLPFQLPIIWGLVGFAIPYIPIAQQRKLVMGLHIPLCILCAYAISLLLTKIPRMLGRIAVVLMILLTTLTNLYFLAIDIDLLTYHRTVTHYPTILSDSQLAAMRYLRTHAKPTDTIFAPPTFSLFSPVFAGVQVYYGHWSETPDYSDKLASWVMLSDITLSDNCWADIIRSSVKQGYYVSEDHNTDVRPALADSFQKCFEADLIRIYRVDLPNDASNSQ